MAQVKLSESVPALSDIPGTHRALMVQLKTHERALAAVKDQQDRLLLEVRQHMTDPTMMLLARQNIGGRVYLRRRWRYGHRTFFDLIDHLHQIESRWHTPLLAIEDRRLSLNYAYSTHYHDHCRLMELKTQRKRLSEMRQRVKKDFLTVTN
jgi:hypothetical protein